MKPPVDEVAVSPSSAATSSPASVTFSSEDGDAEDGVATDVRQAPFRAFRTWALALGLCGILAGRLAAQLPANDEITGISGLKPSRKDERSDQKLVATGIHVLSEKDTALVARLKTAKRLDGMPWHTVKMQLLRSQGGKFYLLRMGEDGETFGIWKCVREGKLYSVPWRENDPYLGCYRIANEAADTGGAATGKAKASASGLHLWIHLDPVGVPFEKMRKTFCHLHDDSPEMKDFLEKLWAEHGERYAGREVSHHGPDHPAAVIAFEKDGRRFVLTSWHPTFRKNPKAVMTAGGGIAAPDTEEARRKVMDEWPAELQQFVTDFDAILDAAEKKLGQPFDF